MFGVVAGVGLHITFWCGRDYTWLGGNAEMVLGTGCVVKWIGVRDL